MSLPKLETIVEELEYAVKFLEEAKPHEDCEHPQIYRGGVMYTKDALRKLKLYAEPRKTPTQPES